MSNTTIPAHLCSPLDSRLLTSPMITWRLCANEMSISQERALEFTDWTVASTSSGHWAQTEGHSAEHDEVITDQHRIVTGIRLHVISQSPQLAACMF
jgi:hypothetical protein